MCVGVVLVVVEAKWVVMARPMPDAPPVMRILRGRVMLNSKISIEEDAAEGRGKYCSCL